MGYVYGRVVQNMNFEIHRKLIINDKGWNLHYNPFSITKYRYAAFKLIKS